MKIQISDSQTDDIITKDLNWQLIPTILIWEVIENRINPPSIIGSIMTQLQEPKNDPFDFVASLLCSFVTFSIRSITCKCSKFASQLLKSPNNLDLK